MIYAAIMFFGGVILFHVVGLFFFGGLSRLWSAAGDLILFFWHEEDSIYKTITSEKSNAFWFLIVLGITAGLLYLLHIILMGSSGKEALDESFKNWSLG